MTLFNLKSYILIIELGGNMVMNSQYVTFLKEAGMKCLRVCLNIPLKRLRKWLVIVGNRVAIRT